MRVDCEIIEREKADVAVGDTLLHEPHEVERRPEILGVVVERREDERAPRERAPSEIGEGGGETVVYLREEAAQLRLRPLVWVAASVVCGGDTVRVEGLDDEARGIGVDLHHVQLLRLVEDEVEPREPRRQVKGVHRVQIGQNLARHIHRACEVVRCTLEHLGGLAEDAEQPGRCRTHLLIERCRERLYRMRGVAICIVGVLDKGENRGIELINIGGWMHHDAPEEERMPARPKPDCLLMSLMRRLLFRS